MPRIKAKKKEYKVSDLSLYIVLEMRKQDISQDEMAHILGITQPGFSYKLKHNAFNYGDLLAIFETLGTEDKDILQLMKF